MAQCMYQHGDGHVHDPETKDRVLSLLINPISIRVLEDAEVD